MANQPPPPVAPEMAPENQSPPPPIAPEMVPVGPTPPSPSRKGILGQDSRGAMAVKMLEGVFKVTASPSSRIGWNRGLILVLVFIHVLIIAAFAISYLSFALDYMLLTKGLGSPIFIAASVTWFALCALLTTVVGRATYAVIDEARLSLSREYIERRLDVFVSANIAQDTLVKLIEHNVSKPVGEKPVDPRSLAPLTALVNSLSETVEALTKKDAG